MSGGTQAPSSQLRQPVSLRLGDLLVTEGLITEQQLQQALQESSSLSWSVSGSCSESPSSGTGCSGLLESDVGLQTGQGPTREPLHAVGRVLLEKVLGQERDVLLALPEGRERNRDGISSVKLGGSALRSSPSRPLLPRRSNCPTRWRLKPRGAWINS